MVWVSLCCVWRGRGFAGFEIAALGSGRGKSGVWDGDNADSGERAFMSKEGRGAAGSIPYAAIAIRVLVPYGVFMVLVSLWAIYEASLLYQGGEVKLIGAVDFAVGFIGRVAPVAFPVFAFIFGGTMIKKIWDWFTYREYFDGVAQAKSEGEAIGVEKGVAQGEAIGVEKGVVQGEAQANERWISYYRRQRAAAERGEDFDEPPPYDGNIDRD